MKKTLYLLIDKKYFPKKFDKKVDLFTLNEFVLSEFSSRLNPRLELEFNPS